uniref:Uncharacterized protein n=1 Tax=Nicotiana tabacum TaxID=4097 RepID=A0A1S3YJW7_TOBAC
MNLCTWNIRGLNKPHKQKELRLFLRKYKVDVMGCLDTRVKERKSARIISQVAREWNLCCNYNAHPNGRIWLLWKGNVNAQIIQIKDQFIHYEVQEPNSNFRTIVTMIYASNDSNQRSQLIGTPVTQGETQGLQDLLNTLQLTQLKSLRWYYTWCNKQEPDKRVYIRIDWAFGNFDWLQQYGHIEAEFLNPDVSDHSHILIKCSQGHQMRSLHPKPFKLYSSVMENAEFKKIVNRVWEQNIQAEPMHKVWQILKMLKGDLKELNAYMTSYKQHLNHARHKLEVIQTKLMVQHLDQDLIEQERRALAEVEKWSNIEEQVHKQKSRAYWITCGDSNSKYFHAQWKMRTSMNAITAIYREDRTKVTNPIQLENEFISFFTKLMGKEAVFTGVQTQKLFNKEVGDDVCDVVKQFFATGKMHKGISSTTVTLIPKVQNPSYVKDYRPISCCTTLYKIITKVITARIKRVIGGL